MTLTAVALVVIAACQLIWLAVAIVAMVRVRALARRVEPIIENVQRVSEHATHVVQQVEDMARVARQVEARVAGTADLVLNQIEPPIRTFAAALAGLRAGVGKFLDHRSSGNHNAITVSHLTGRDLS
jgi:hypothetical protein